MMVIATDDDQALLRFAQTYRHPGSITIQTFISIHSEQGLKCGTSHIALTVSLMVGIMVET